MIQIISCNVHNWAKSEEVVISKLSSPQDLDNYEVNFIDFSDEDLWKNDDGGCKSINSIKDLDSIRRMIDDSSQKTKIIIILPQNIKLLSSYQMYTNSYNESFFIKDIISTMCESILKNAYLELYDLNLIYANTQTNIGGEDIPAAFYIQFKNKEKVLTRSKVGDKPTTVILKKVIVTTLKLNNYDLLTSFLKEIGLNTKEEERAPEWIGDINMFDDSSQIRTIAENEEVIRSANERISDAKNKIDRNNHYKAILYTSGKLLESTVREILGEMLEIDLSSFVDENKQDFTIDVDGFILIGEIKGVNTNVRLANISQLEVHHKKYIDDNPDCDRSKLKRLLIINHQRDKPLSERRQINDEQISLAENYGSVIIETITLLRIFEKFKAGKMGKDKIVELLTINTGLLTFEG